MDEVIDAEIVAPTYDIIVHHGHKLPQQYVPLIFVKWLQSLRHGNPLFEKIKSDEYYKHYHTFIENLMKKPDSLIRLAVLSDDHDVVLGFSASREDVLDYVQVQRDYRRIGVARALIPAGITTFTHLTKTAMNIWQDNQHYKHLKFNPFA